MVDDKFTHIAVILDRSGSMATLKTDMEGGFNTFIEEQKKVAGRCTLSLYQFDDVYEVVYKGKEVKDVPVLDLQPRNMTALLDAVGKTINDVGTELAALKEEERPGKVILVIITDGQENASHEFKRERISEMIKHQEDKYTWQIVFLGANFDAYTEGMGLGFTGSKCMTYAANAVGTRCCYSSVSAKITDYRLGNAKGVDFDVNDRQAQQDAGAVGQ